MWSYNYPNNVNREGIMMMDCDPHFNGYCTELPQGVFPTPFYETLMALAIFFILWSLRKRIKTAGIITSLYLLLNGLERLLIEQIRVNNKFDFLGMKVTQAEVIACLFILSGAALLYYFTKKSNSPKQTVDSAV
jgi:prolipoprotein diacylglyceryltransferase